MISDWLLTHKADHSNRHSNHTVCDTHPHPPENVVNPALLPQLPHGGIDPGVASAALSPALQHASIVLPRQRQADGVVDTVIEVGNLQWEAIGRT